MVARPEGKGWLTVRVVLEGGAGIDCDPPPGRVFLVGPEDTFGDLAQAIDLAFARWDLSHLHLFDLAGERRIGEADPEWDDVEDEDAITVAGELNVGDTFGYTFDLGDEWTHTCTVTGESVNPEDAYGVRPANPVPIFGWGWIPDQYGREAEDE